MSNWKQLYWRYYRRMTLTNTKSRETLQYGSPHGMLQIVAYYESQ
jgi:hypothetical protein